MHKNVIPHRVLWLDKFAHPTIEQLLDALQAESKPHFLAVLAHIKTNAKLNESLEWTGLPWRWSLLYRPKGRKAGREILVYLIPDPQGPSAVFRMEQTQIENLPIKKLSRFLREGIGSCRLVAGVCWPQWTISSQSQAEDLIHLFGLLRKKP